jgi:hypothetical protein
MAVAYHRTDSFFRSCRNAGFTRAGQRAAHEIAAIHASACESLGFKPGSTFLPPRRSEQRFFAAHEMQIIAFQIAEEV